MDMSHFFSGENNDDKSRIKELEQMLKEERKLTEKAVTLLRQQTSNNNHDNGFNSILDTCININNNYRIFKEEITNSDSIVLFINKLMNLALEMNEYSDSQDEKLENIKEELKEKDRQMKELNKSLSTYKDLYYSVNMKNNQSNDIKYIRPKEMEITLSDILKIKQLIELKVPYRKICKQTGWSTFTISRIKNGHYDKYLE